MLKNKNIYILFIILFANIILAESFSFTSNHNYLVVNGATDTTVVLEATVKNLTDQDIVVKGKRSINNIPESWISRMCFGNCYPESMDETDEIDIWASDSMTFELDVVISSEAGNASIDITMTSGLESKTITFEINTKSTNIDDRSIIIEKYILNDNYPNPFNPTTNISYYLSQNAHVQLSVFDMKGKIVQSLINMNQSKGTHLTTWNGMDSNGVLQAAGVYYYQLKVLNNGTLHYLTTKKMVLLK